MIKKLKLINFRNFGEKVIFFEGEKNFIVGENGKGKTNILEALSILGNNSIINLNFEELIKIDEKYFFIEYEDIRGNNISVSYDSEKKRKKYIVNGKAVSKNKFASETYKCSSFSPIIMNMMYLSPSLRRDFLDEILDNSFEGFSKLSREYTKIVKSRNKVLRNIYEGKSEKGEIEFWNDKFVSLASEIYNYRFKIIKFFEENINGSLEYFTSKISNIEFKYISKVKKDNIEESLREYINKNLERDIIIGKTQIGPHVDDFDIIIDGLSLSHFASRGETKSVIIWLKLLETVFIEKKSNKKPILLIDDLLSELDKIHKDMIINKIKYYQTFITSIDKLNEDNLIRL